MKKATFLFLFLAAAVCAAPATTWYPTTVACPLCGTENDFMAVGSYGSYIYSWPSKYQYIFWPLTDSQALYRCRSCGYSAFMWDFEEAVENRKNELIALLVPLARPYTGDYYRTPMSERLAIAESVYRLLGKDDEFFCLFHRVAAYHLEGEGKGEEADAARRQALALAEKLAAEPAAAGRAKLFTFIAGSMRYFTGDEAGARRAFQSARRMTYLDPAAKPENSAGLDTYLNGLLDDFIKAIGEGKKLTIRS